jgi:hypothetical protein
VHLLALFVTPGTLYGDRKIVCHTHGGIDSCVVHSLKATLGSAVVVIALASLRNRKLSGTREAAAIATLLGGFRAVHCFLFRLSNSLRHKTDGIWTKIREQLDHKREFIAGVLSTLIAGRIDDTVSSNSVLLIWIMVRAVRSAIPFNIPYSSLLVMCLSTTQLLSTWIRAPYEHSDTYWTFLNVQGGQLERVLKAYWDCYDNMGALRLNGCAAIHPNSTCLPNALRFFRDGLFRALPVYIPVHLLSFLFSKKRSLERLAENIIRSCVFLSSYCTLAWFVSCLWFKVDGGVTRKRLLAFLWIPGFAVLFEPPSRRTELAAYCLTHALNSIWNHLKRKHKVTPSPLLAKLLLALTIGTLLHHNDQQPHFITKYLFGIRHLSVLN